MIEKKKRVVQNKNKCEMATKGMQKLDLINAYLSLSPEILLLYP